MYFLLFLCPREIPVAVVQKNSRNKEFLMLLDAQLYRMFHELTQKLSTMKIFLKTEKIHLLELIWPS